MELELKLRITNSTALDQRLSEIGAIFNGETMFEDIYFNQPAGKVLKIVKKANGNFLNVFEEREGRFIVIEDREVINLAITEQKLTAKFGVKRILKGRRKYYQFKQIKLTYNDISGIGKFLILTSEDPRKDFIISTLGIKHPVFISTSFDDL